MKKLQPIQIIGTQRSGSNLLRLMLNQFAEIAAPHPPHILDRFSPLLQHYGELEIDSNMYQLVDDVCRLIELNPVPWNNGISFNRFEIMEKCINNSLTEIFRIIYEHKAKREKADFWVCKSMVNINFTEDLEKMDVKPIYIHLIRDGRDVACSYKHAIVGEKHVYHISRFWREQQAACLKLKDKLEPQRFIQVKYESLINDPQKEMHRIAEFLKIKYTPEVLNYYHSKESEKVARAGEMWRNLTKPVIRENYNKYKHELTKDEIILFEHLAGNILSKLGYTLDYPEEKNHIKLSLSEINYFNSENKRLKSEVLHAARPTDLKKRRGQKELMEEIKARHTKNKTNNDIILYNTSLKILQQ